METVILQRLISTPRLVMGVLAYDSPLCYTLEPAWRQNKNYLSCIPAGFYLTHKEDNHPRFGTVWRLANVPNRSGILIHAGNLVENTSGCILPGLEATPTTVRHSRLAISRLEQRLPPVFHLYVKDIT